jgi:hypothetical protein
MQLPRLIGGVHHPEPRREPRNRAEKRRVHGAKRFFHNRALAGAMARKAAYQINSSLLFRGAQYLSRTPSVAGDRKTWTFSALVRRGTLGSSQNILDCSVDANNRTHIYFTSTDTIAIFSMVGGVQYCAVATTDVFRDPSSWMHVVVKADFVATPTIAIYINGTQQTLTTTTLLTHDSMVNSTNAHTIGRRAYSSDTYYGGSVAEPILVDGAALTPSSFGEVDPVALNWRPRRPRVSAWGTNGAYLGKGGWTWGSLGTDYSGQGNNWTATGFASTDVLSDSPTNIYATLNLLDKHSSITLTNGNLVAAAAGTWNGVGTTLRIPSSGKWAFKAIRSVGGNMFVGLVSSGHVFSGAAMDSSVNPAVAWRTETGQIYKNGALQTTVTASGTGDVHELLVDVDAQTVKFYRQGSLVYTMSSVATATLTQPYASLFGSTATFDFGQGGYVPTDAAYKALCTSNLPATTGTTSGSFTGNASTDGKCVYTGAVPETLSIDGNAVTWGTHALKLATGFKIITASSPYNQAGTRNWTATYNGKPTVGGGTHAPALAQGNP